MSYQVEFLNDQAFEALPYRDMHQKVGVADPRTMRAFVRKSGMPVMDAFNAAHELDHLQDGHQGVHADHYDPEHGVYYKDFGNVLMAAAPLALSALFPGIGTALGGALGGFGSALSGAGSSIAGALGSIPGIGGALGGAAQSIGGALGGLGSAAGGALGMGGGQAAADQSLLQGSLEPTTRGVQTAFGSQLGGGQSLSSLAGGGGGIGSLFSDTAKSLGQNVGQNGLNSLFGQQGSPYGMQSMGSYSPNVSGASGGPNMIAGASGAGSSGGPGGSPGSVGGGQVSKIKQELESDNNSTPNPGGFNGGMK